jgi:hypothetical protein
MTDLLHQENIERRDQAVSIGVLQEQMRSVMASLADQKNVNAAQSLQLSEILEKLSEAKGGWRTLMWLGGGAATIGGLITWVSQHLTFR